MKNTKSLLWISILAFIAIFMYVRDFNKDISFIGIGTASITGVYYPIGSTICKMINGNQKSNKLKCSVMSTMGSVYNANSLNKKNMEFAIVQADSVFNAFHGHENFKDEMKNLRVVALLHEEKFTALSKKTSDITNFRDIENHRVNMGSPGSSTHGTVKRLMRAYRWNRENFTMLTKLKVSEQASYLCDGMSDVVMYDTGHPNGGIQEAHYLCTVKIIPVQGETIEQVIANNPFYTHAHIKKSSYPWLEKDIPTFGMRAALLTTADVDDKTVYEFSKAFFENVEKVQNIHPALYSMKSEEFIANDWIIPMHDGTKKYLTESGMLSESSK